jgi:hypothetical protein
MSTMRKSAFTRLSQQFGCSRQRRVWPNSDQILCDAMQAALSMPSRSARNIFANSER